MERGKQVGKSKGGEAEDAGGEKGVRLAWCRCRCRCSCAGRAGRARGEGWEASALRAGAHQPAGARLEEDRAHTTASAGLPATARPQPGCGARVVAAAGPGVMRKRAPPHTQSSRRRSLKGRATVSQQPLPRHNHLCLQLLEKQLKENGIISVPDLRLWFLFFSLKIKEERAVLLGA